MNPDLNALTRTLCDELHATLTAGQPLFVTPHSIRRQIDIMARAQSQGTWPHTGHAIDSREVHA